MAGRKRRLGISLLAIANNAQVNYSSSTRLFFVSSSAFVITLWLKPPFNSSFLSIASATVQSNELLKDKLIAVLYFNDLLFLPLVSSSCSCSSSWCTCTRDRAPIFSYYWLLVANYTYNYMLLAHLVSKRGALFVHLYYILIHLHVHIKTLICIDLSIFITSREMNKKSLFCLSLLQNMDSSVHERTNTSIPEVQEVTSNSRST